MGNTLSKVERDGFADTVQKLMKGGMTTATKIHQVLKDKHGAKLSLSSVTRYVVKIKDTISDDAFKTIREHVEKVVPEDLIALEEMEKMCLDWANEDSKEMADRLADAAILIDRDVNEWVALLMEVSTGTNRDKKIKQIIRKAISYVIRDARLQTKRIQAMNTAVKIITLKLQQAGLLEDDASGRIIILDRSKDYDKNASKQDFISVPYLVKASEPDNTGGAPRGP